jgi:hypothetical protein
MSAAAPRPRWPLALLLLALPACRSADEESRDLRALHAEDGSLRTRIPRLLLPHAVTSALESGELEPWLDFCTVGALPLEPETAALAEDDPGRFPRGVKRPAERTIDRFSSLAARDPDWSYVAGLQVEWAGTLVTSSGSQVVRERAVEVLAEAARRLGVTALSPPPARPTPAPWLRERLSALGTAAGETLRGGDGAAVSAALAQLSPAQLDLDAALAVLRATTLLGRALPREARGTQWAERHAEGERRVISLALAAALEDPADFVAARALEAHVALDRGQLFDHLRRSLTSGRWQSVHTALQSIIDEGPPAGEPPLDVWIELIVGATQAPVGDGPAAGAARLAACRALARIAPTELRSLRPEDWVVWYWEYSGRVVDEALRDRSASSATGDAAEEGN